MNQNDNKKPQGGKNGSNMRGVFTLVAWALILTVLFSSAGTYMNQSMDASTQVEVDYSEFKAMVEAVRHTEAALGDGKKHVTSSEAPNKAVARKSIVAARPIQAGEEFTADNLTTKRPGDGISPMRWYQVLGQRAKRDFEEDEKIEL